MKNQFPSRDPTLPLHFPLGSAAAGGSLVNIYICIFVLLKCIYIAYAYCIVYVFSYCLKVCLTRLIQQQNSGHDDLFIAVSLGFDGVPITF